jgi:hypothetical protein
MADEELENPEEGQEPVASPTPQVSAPSAERSPSAPSGVTEDRLAEMLESQEKRLLEQFERQSQSVKDKRIAAIMKEVDELRNIKTRLDAVGGDWERLEQEATQESLARRLQEMEARIAKPDPGRSWDAEWQDESQRILANAESRYGVTVTTEEMQAAFNGRNFTSKGDAYAALSDIVVAKIRGESVPVSAVAGEGRGETPPPPADALQAASRLGKLKDQGASRADREKALADAVKAIGR